MLALETKHLNAHIAHNTTFPKNILHSLTIKNTGYSVICFHY